MQDPGRSDEKRPSEVETPDFQNLSGPVLLVGVTRDTYTIHTSLYNKDFYKVVSFRTNFIHISVDLHFQAASGKDGKEHGEECSATARQATTFVL